MMHHHLEKALFKTNGMTNHSKSSNGKSTMPQKWQRHHQNIIQKVQYLRPFKPPGDFNTTGDRLSSFFKRRTSISMGVSKVSLKARSTLAASGECRETRRWWLFGGVSKEKTGCLVKRNIHKENVLFSSIWVGSIQEVIYLLLTCLARF